VGVQVNTKYIQIPLPLSAPKYNYKTES